jgi:hypothetical protein
MSALVNQSIGYRETIHTVVKGESLSLIARHYQARGWPVNSWVPIYRLTGLRTGLWNTKGTTRQHENPDLIYPGDVLIIPRSPHAYDVRIGEIQKLGRNIFHEENEVTKIKEEMESYGKRIDLISDVLQLIVTCGGTALRSAKAAKSLTGVAAKEALHIRNEAYKEIGKEVLKFAGEKGADAIDENLGIATKIGTKSFPKAIEISKALTTIHKVKDAGMVLARGVDFVLDWVNPSTLAKAWISFRDGESPDATLNHMELAFENHKAALLKQLAERAGHLRWEKEYVYGKDK